MDTLERSTEALWELPPPAGGIHLQNDMQKIEEGKAHFENFLPAIARVCNGAGIQVSLIMRFTGVIKVKGEPNTLQEVEEALMLADMVTRSTELKPAASSPPAPANR